MGDSKRYGKGLVVMLELKPGLMFRHKVNLEVYKIVAVGIELRGSMTYLYPSTTCYLYLELKSNIMAVRREQDWALESTSWEEVRQEYKPGAQCCKCYALTTDWQTTPQGNVCGSCRHK